MPVNSANNPYSVSVVIPAYNSAEYISRTIESVLEQTLPADEIIVIDDGSTDNTQQVLQKYSDKITYIHQQNAGASSARNTGINTANSEWIAFLDADDEWLPDKLKTQIDHLKRNPDLQWSCSNYIIKNITENWKKTKFQHKKADVLLKSKEYYNSFFSAFSAKTIGWTGTMIIKRKVLFEAGLFSTELSIAEDIDLWFRIAYKYPKIGCLCQPLAVYNTSTPQSLMKSTPNIETSAAMLRKHLAHFDQPRTDPSVKNCFKKIIHIWIRGLLFKNEPQQIKLLLKDFNCLTNPLYKMFINMLIINPSLTASVLNLISKTLRPLGLAKKKFN